MGDQQPLERAAHCFRHFMCSCDVIFKLLEVALGVVFWWPLASQSLRASKNIDVPGLGTWEKMALSGTCIVWLLTLFLLIVYSFDLHRSTFTSRRWSSLEATFDLISWFVFFVSSLVAINFPHHTLLGSIPMVSGFTACFVYLFNGFTRAINYYSEVVYSSDEYANGKGIPRLR